MRRRVQVSFVCLSAALIVGPTSRPVVAAQDAPTLRAKCDDLEVTKAKALFVRMRDQRKVDPQVVSAADFRRAAVRYIELSKACYDARYGAAAKPETRIDDDGVFMEGEIPEFNTNGRKWGAGSPFAGGQDVPGPGIPGGTVTWSFTADGVDMSAEPASPNVAIQSLPTFQGCFVTEIEDAFDAWSAVSDIQFVQVADNGIAFNGAGAAGDIRVGAHVFDGPGGVLAHGYFPPPNGVSAAGDIHFDQAENWDCVDTGPQFDIGVVVTHEIGHAIGLNHESPPPTALMNPTYNPAVHIPLADDITAAESIYGGVGPSCVLDVSLAYAAGTFTMNLHVGASEATTLNAWFTYDNNLLPLFSVPLPPIDPAVDVPIAFPLPSLETVGVLTTLTTPGDGILCSDFETVDTNP
jgi:hypothetical protein